MTVPRFHLTRAIFGAKGEKCADFAKRHYLPNDPRVGARREGFSYPSPAFSSLFALFA